MATKWEYCALSGISRNNDKQKYHPGPWFPAVWEFTGFGTNVHELKGNEVQELGQAIAKMGEDGWEMVGTGNTAENTHVIYFKRQKRSE